MRLMGVVNVTPDSFSDGGRFLTPARAIDHALALLAAGADVIDVGGESTRPGSQPTSADEELARVIPVLEGLRARVDAPLSIDTQKAAVAAAALAAGAEIINDVSALADEGMAALAARTGAGLVLMHMRGQPRDMQDDPRYDDVVEDVRAFLDGRVEAAVAAGVPRDRILVDPGIGFGKTLEHNVALLAGLPRLRSLGCRVLVGLSRKGMIGALTGRPIEARAAGSVGGALAAVAAGADVVRVHDVAETVDALAVWGALTAGGSR